MIARLTNNRFSSYNKSAQYIIYQNSKHHYYRIMKNGVNFSNKKHKWIAISNPFLYKKLIYNKTKNFA